MSDSLDQTPAEKLRNTSHLRSTGCGIAIGSALGIVLLLVVWISAVRDPLPALTPAALDAAKRLWKETGPASYDLEFTTIVGGQAGDYVVEVRSGEVVRVTRNGVEVPDRGEAWDARSIQGLFKNIDREIELVADPKAAFGVSDSSGIVQQAQFDEKFGFPRRYRRIVPGADRQFERTVTRFVVVE